jgi:hypothetical protein
MEFLKTLAKIFNPGLAFPEANKAGIPSEPVPVGEKRLDIVYNTQRDNAHRPSGSCNVTSLQMALGKYVKVKDDDLFERANSKEMKAWVRKSFPNLEERYFREDRMNIIWAVLEKLAREEIGKEYAKWHEPGVPFEDLMKRIRNEIDMGYAVVIGGRFTASGHIVCVVGYNEAGLVVHDPWGVAPKYTDRNGAYVTYSYEYLKKIMSGRHLLVHADRRTPAV